jgi:hypothetical protein
MKPDHGQNILPPKHESIELSKHLVQQKGLYAFSRVLQYLSFQNL